MKTPEQSNPQPDIKHRSFIKLTLILVASMIAYGTVFLLLSLGHYSTMQICFVVQVLNALGFFIGLAAFVKSSQRN